MALKRSFLKGLGLTDEQIDAIIEAHAETTDALKKQIEELKAEAEKQTELSEKYENAQKELKAANAYKEKYEAEKTAHETLKTDIATKATKAAKEKAVKELLTTAGISEKRIPSILKVTDLNGYEVGEDGKIKDADKATEYFKTEYADFIETVKTEGAKTVTPPQGSGGVKSREEIDAITDPVKRQEEIAKNIGLYRKE